MEKQEYKEAELQQFWVGLMDGDGSIQVNHWRSVNLQYRIIIKLKNTEANLGMLTKIAKQIGGRARVEREDALWVVDSQEQIKEIIKIFEKYPPITTKMQLQIQFLKACIKGVPMSWYLEQRVVKYADQPEMAKARNQEWKVPEYFDIWLAGFTEAEGCFSTTEKIGMRYSIGQMTDRYILEAIREKLKMGSRVLERSTPPGFYVIETGAREALGEVIEHFSKYPLLGEKLVSFNRLKEKYKEKNKE